jgi:hypothetical protein
MSSKGERGGDRDLPQRPRRSKRGISKDDTVQLCFRIAKALARQLKSYCCVNEMEIGEVGELAIKQFLARQGP